jgi:hypothetical protein
MTGAFDAAQALRAGLGDRRQAWEFIREFAAAWTAPLGPGDGVSADALGSAERHIGAGLPAALREAYLLFGRRPDLTAVQDPLVLPGELGLDDAGNAVVFRAENQRCAAWGVAAADLSSPDPPVYVRHRGGWQPFLNRVSTACVEMVLSEVLLGRRQLGDMCELPAELVTTVESAYGQLPVPEYPSWYDRGIGSPRRASCCAWTVADPTAGWWPGARPWPIWNPSARRSPAHGSRCSGQARNPGNRHRPLRPARHERALPG